MTMKLKVLRADPAGNITLFVLTPVGRGEDVCRFLVEACGCDHPVAVDVDKAAGTARTSVSAFL